MLQQHEANDQCVGGALCLLNSPIYNSPSLLHVSFWPPNPLPHDLYRGIFVENILFIPILCRLSTSMCSVRM